MQDLSLQSTLIAQFLASGSRINIFTQDLDQV